MPVAQQYTASELYGNVILTLDEMDKSLAEAKKELHKVSRVRGADAAKMKTAIDAFNKFEEEYIAKKEEFKQIAAGFKKEEDEKSKLAKLYKALDKLGEFAKSGLEKANSFLGDPVGRIRNNEILVAVGKVISTSCTSILCTLNHAVAVGELAESVIDLGTIVYEKVVYTDEPDKTVLTNDQSKFREGFLYQLDGNLDLVSQWMGSAEKSLQAATEKAGKQEDAKEALVTIKGFNEKFGKLKSEIAQQTDSVNEDWKSHYKNSGFGQKLIASGEKWLQSAGNFIAADDFEAPGRNISNAALKVVRCAGKVVVSTLEQLVATGKVAKSAVELGTAVKKAVTPQKQQAVMVN